MANRELRRRRRKEQHRARREAGRVGFDPESMNEWAALIVEASLVGIRDVISLPDRILREIGAGQGVRTAQGLVPPGEIGLRTMSLDDWEALVTNTEASAVDRVIDLMTGACFAAIGYQSAKSTLRRCRWN